MARRYGVLFRGWRRANGLSQAAAGRLCGCSQVFLLEVEKGKKPFGPTSAVALRMLDRCPAPLVDVWSEALLWGLSRDNTSLLCAAAKAVAAELRDGSRLHGTVQSLIDAAWARGAGASPGGEEAATVLVGAAWDVYAWPRALLIDFLLETVAEWRWALHSETGETGRANGWVELVLRDDVVAALPAAKAARCVSAPPWFPLTEYTPAPAAP